MLFPDDAAKSDLHEEIVLLFREAQLEMVHCWRCGDYHPPDLHLAPIDPLDDYDVDQPGEITPDDSATEEA